MKEVNAQKLLQEFENIKFKDGESVEDFGMRITNLVGNLRALGEIVEDIRVVKKFLRVVPARFTQVVVTIEMFCDLKALSVDELVGRLRVAEERIEDKVEQVVDKKGVFFSPRRSGSRKTSIASAPTTRREVVAPVPLLPSTRRNHDQKVGPRVQSS